MGSTDQISTALPDLLAVSLEELAALAPLGLDQAVQRVLPESPVAPEPGTAFASSI